MGEWQKGRSKEVVFVGNGGKSLQGLWLYSGDEMLLEGFKHKDNEVCRNPNHTLDSETFY